MTELLTQLLGPTWLAYTIAALVQCALLLVVALCSAAVFIWLERKVSARIQDRLGPTRVGGRFGWLQPPADGMKLLCKEDIIPAAADRPLFRLAPYVSFCATFCVFLALPFANGWVALRLDAGAFFLLAVAGLEVFGVILGGYASGSKWSLYGAMREAAQVVSYEIPLALCVVVPVLIAGTMDLVEIGNRQAGWFYHWYLFHDPFTFVTFWVYVDLRRGQHEPGAVRFARGRKRVGGRLPHRVFRLPLGDFFHGRVRGDVRRQRAGGRVVPGRLERPDSRRFAAGTWPAIRTRVRRLARQPAGHVQFHRQGRARRDVHDLAPLDAAAAADRPGDDHVLEVLRAVGLGHVGRRDALDLLFPGGWLRTELSPGRAGRRSAASVTDD